MRERERERIKHLVSDNKPDQTERESSCYQLEHINFLFEFRIPKQKKLVVAFINVLDMINGKQKSLTFYITCCPSLSVSLSIPLSEN